MFEDPCLSTNYVDAAALRRYTFVKLMVPVLLAALLLGMWGINQRYEAIGDPTFTNPTGILAPGAATLAGTGAPGSTIEVRIDNQPIGSTIVSADGRWSLETDDLAPGEYEYEALALDPDGIERGRSAPFSFSVAAPIVYAAPTLTLPSDEFDPDAIELTGTGTPGSTVELFQNGRSVGTAVVGDDGTFAFTVSADGVENEFEVVGRDPDGGDIGSSGVALLTIMADPAAFVFNLPVVSDFSPGDGGLPSGSFVLSGEGEPGSTVEISLDGEPIGSTTVGSDGSWSFGSDLSRAPGNYDITASNILASGDAFDTASAEITIPVLGTLALDSAEVDEVGFFSLSGTAVPGSDVEIIIDGQVVDRITATEDGDWTWNSNTMFAFGDHDVQVRLAENAASSTEAQIVTIFPFVTISEVDVSALSGDRADVTVNGRASALNDVQLYFDDELVEIVTADADGNWSYETSLPSGSTIIVARIADDGGTVLVEAGNRANVGDVVGGLQLLYGGSSDIEDDPEGAMAVALAGIPAVEIILDASWSMTTAFESSSRFDSAQRALTNTVNRAIPEGAPFALRIFGNIEGSLACRTDLMVPYGPLERDEVNAVIANAAPQFNANTPLAASLQMVAEDLAESTEEERIVVLLTDGEETCDGDPAAAIQELVDAGFNVQVNIVGLAIADEVLKAEFERWARIGGGTYYDVTNLAQLNTVLREAAGAFFTVRDANGETVATSRVGGRPLDLPPGTYSVEVRTSPDTIIEDIEVMPDQTLRIVLR